MPRGKFSKTLSTGSATVARTQWRSRCTAEVQRARELAKLALKRDAFDRWAERLREIIGQLARPRWLMFEVKREAVMAIEAALLPLMPVAKHWRPDRCGQCAHAASAFAARADPRDLSVLRGKLVQHLISDLFHGDEIGEHRSTVCPSDIGFQRLAQIARQLRAPAH